MTETRARAIVPMYASQDGWQEQLPPKRTEPRPPRRSPDDWFHDFKIRNGIALIILFAWAASMMVGCCITGVIVRKRTAKQVVVECAERTSEGFRDYMDGKNTEAASALMQQGLQDFLNWQAAEAQKAQFLTGDASFAAAVETIADPMSYVLAAYRMEFGVTEEGQRTIGWTFCARGAQGSTEFGRTPQEILEKSGAWEGKPVGHARSNQDIELAREIATAYLKGEYPDGFTTSMTFFTRESGGKIIARNEFNTGPYTTYWWFGK